MLTNRNFYFSTSGGLSQLLILEVTVDQKSQKLKMYIVQLESKTLARLSHIK